MKFEDTVKVLAEKREKLLNSVELCFDSVNFWEEKAHILFNEIDELEENYSSFPETELEKKRFDGALRRRQLSLILAGKLKANDASELKALFQ